jgi:hypothetical protein
MQHETILTHGRWKVIITDNGVSIVDNEAQTVDGVRPASILHYGVNVEGVLRNDRPALVLHDKGALQRNLVVSRHDVREGDVKSLKENLEVQEWSEKEISKANS